MNKFWSYISAALAGALVVCLIGIRYILKNSNQPVVNIDTLIEEVNQSIKKLKQDGTGNVQDIKPSIIVSKEENNQDFETEPKKKKFLFIFNKRKN